MPTRRTVLKGAGFTVAGALVGCIVALTAVN